MSQAKIINKCPHPIYILDSNNAVLKMFPKSSGMIRVPETSVDVGNIDGVPISSTTWSETRDVPEPETGIYYIVSQMVKSALPKRPDLLVPRGIVKNEENQIIGCRKLDIGSLEFNPELSI